VWASLSAINQACFERFAAALPATRPLHRSKRRCAATSMNGAHRAPETVKAYLAPATIGLRVDQPS